MEKFRREIMKKYKREIMEKQNGKRCKSTSREII